MQRSGAEYHQRKNRPDPDGLRFTLHMRNTSGIVVLTCHLPIDRDLHAIRLIVFTTPARNAHNNLATERQVSLEESPLSDISKHDWVPGFWKPSKTGNVRKPWEPRHQQSSSIRSNADGFGKDAKTKHRRRVLIGLTRSPLKKASSDNLNQKTPMNFYVEPGLKQMFASRLRSKLKTVPEESDSENTIPSSRLESFESSQANGTEMEDAWSAGYAC